MEKTIQREGMIKIKEIEQLMKPNFIFDKIGKRLQTLEVHDGTKEVARTIMVGLCDMYGIDGTFVMDYLDIGYDTYRNRLRQFREVYKLARDADEEGVLQVLSAHDIRMYNKIRLCLNAIKLSTQRDSYNMINEYIHGNHD